MVNSFLGALETDPHVYSQFFALPNEEFLQVIGTRGEARIALALKAPAQAHFAVRRITLDTSGQ